MKLSKNRDRLLHVTGINCFNCLQSQMYIMISNVSTIMTCPDFSGTCPDFSGACPVETGKNPHLPERLAVSVFLSSDDISY